MLFKLKELEASKAQLFIDLQTYVELSESECDRIWQLLLKGAVECWLYLKNSECIGFALTHKFYDELADKHLFLVYLLRTLHTISAPEMRKFYQELCYEAKKQECFGLCFYTSFQNEKKFEMLRSIGGIGRTYFFVEV